MLLREKSPVNVERTHGMSKAQFGSRVQVFFTSNTLRHCVSLVRRVNHD